MVKLKLHKFFFSNLKLGRTETTKVKEITKTNETIKSREIGNMLKQFKGNVKFFLIKEYLPYTAVLWFLINLPNSLA